MFKKSIAWCKGNIIFVSILSLLLFFQLIYISNATINIPVMDYWRYINNYVDKCFMGGIPFSELYESYCGHKGLLVPLLFVINVIFFKLNVRVSTFFAIAIMGTIAIFVYNLFLSTVKTCARSIDYGKSIVQQIWGSLIVFPIFNLNQWEILTLEFATPFMLRVLVTVALLVFVDRLLLRKIENYNILCVCVICVIAAINLALAGYSVAFIGAVFVTLIFNLIVHGKNVDYKVNICLVFSLIIGLVVYLRDIKSAISEIEISVTSLILNFPKAFLVLLGSSIFHENLAKESLGMKSYYIVGSMLLLIYLASVFIYVKKRYYNFSYLPIMLICYTFCNMGCIYISRFPYFGLGGMASSRYVVDTTLGLIGTIWIFSLIFFDDYTRNSKKKSLFRTNLSVFLVIVVSFFLFFTNVKEHKISAYRCVYFRELINKVENIEALSDEELCQFQANSPEMVRSGVNLMKKYHLGICKYL